MENRENSSHKAGISQRTINIVIIIALISIADNIWLYSTGAKSNGNAVQNTNKVLYTCPMHHQIISDHPGDCPICGMKLVKKESASTGVEASSAAGEVTLSPGQEALANIAVEKPIRMSFGNEQHAPGRIIAMQDANWKYSLRVMGRIDSLYVTEPGVQVKTGEPLFSLYSPDLSSAEQEWIAASQTEDANLRASFLTAAENKLFSLGMTGEQMENLRKEKRSPNILHLPLPATGL